MRLLLAAAFVCLLLPVASRAQPGGGVAVGSVSNSTVTATGTGTVPLTLTQIQSATFRPENYGAKYDGVTDDSAAWTNLITDLTAQGYGQIILKSGTTIVGPGIIKLPSNAMIIGQGKSSIIQWSSTQSSSSWLISVSGTASSPTAPLVNDTLQDFQLSGGSGTGGSPLIQAYYSAELHITNVSATSCTGFIDAVQLWDARWNNLDATFCALTATAGAAIYRVRNSAAASGFGFSSDSSNQDFFTNIRAEQFEGNAFRVEQGTGSSKNPNGIYVNNFKAENKFIIGNPFFYIGPAVNASSFRNLYFSADSFDSGHSTPSDLLSNNGGGQNDFQDIFLAQSLTGLVGNPFLQNSTNADRIGMVYFSAVGTPTSNTIINITGGANPDINGPVYGFPAISSVTGYGTAVTGTYSVLQTDNYLQADASGGNVILNLPAAANAVGHNLVVTKLDSSANTVTINRAGSDLIGGNTSALVSSQYSSVTLRPYGTGWYITGQQSSGVPAQLNVAQSFTAAQRGAPSTLTISTSTFTPSFDTAQNFSVTLVNAQDPNTIANPSTTPVAGQSGVIAIAQSATGSDTINWGGQYKFAGGSPPTLSTTPNAVDFFPYYVFSSTQIIVGAGISNAH